MNQKPVTERRHRKADLSTAFRCSVNFTASEQAQLLAMQEKAGVKSTSAFIKAQLFGKKFKVHVIDDNTRRFIDMLSNFNNRYREIGIEYDLLVKTLREFFTEKKALSTLAEVEKRTIELVKLNRRIVQLAKELDERWSQKSP